MKNKRRKSGLTILALSMIMANLNISILAADGTKVMMPEMNPSPKEVTELGNGYTLSGNVNLVGEDQADADAVRVLKEVLTSNGIHVNHENVAGDTTIIIAELEDQLSEAAAMKEELDIEDASTLHEEGYVLAAKQSGEKQEILIEGKDETGTFYGVQTLRNMLQKDGNEVQTPEVIVRDDPDMKNRGVIEGFYGTPWSHEARLDQLRFYGKNKLNLYIYAPKDDPYHREKWREEYPESEMARMQELIDTAHENKVNFVFALSPGNDIRFDGEAGEEDLQALINKAEAMYAMGVRSYAIFFDDIADRSGAKQAEVLNAFNERFIQTKDDVTPLLTVPTEYFSSGMDQEGGKSPYTKAFSETLDEGIEVMWTGQEVVSQGVSKADAQKVYNFFNRKMALWWNYPVTDYNTKKLALGPIYNLDQTIDEEVSMLAINPMEFAQTSKITIATGADYSWNLDDYDSDASWRKAIRQLYGENAEDFTYFANHTTRVDNGRADAPEMQAQIDEFWNHVETGADISGDAAYLRSEFAQMKAVSQRLLGNLPQAILAETKLQLEQFAKDTEYAEEALKMIETFLAGDMSGWWDLKHSSEIHMEESKNAPAQVSNVIKQFISDAHEQANKLYENTIPKDETEVIAYTGSASMEALNYAKWWYNAQPYEAQNFAIENHDYAYRSKENVQKDSWIQIDLGKSMEIHSLYLLQGRTEVDHTVTGSFSYSSDGETWIALPGTYKDYETILTDLDINARYVRFTAQSDEEFQYFVRDFKVNKDVHEEYAEASIAGVETEVVRTIEGTDKFLPVITANFKDKTTVKAGDTLTLTLRDYTYIKDVQATFGVKGKIEFTRNQIDWVEATEEALSEHPFVSSVRFTAQEDGTISDAVLKVITEERNPGTITTNYNFRSDAGEMSDLNDYDLGSNCTDTSTKAGQWLQLDLGEVTRVRDLKVIFNEAYGGDRPTDVTFSYSEDGESWTELPFNVYSWNNHFTNLNISAHYIKMVNNTDRAGTWTRIGEFTVNSPTPEIHFETSVNGKQPTNRITNLTDGDLKTTYVPESAVKAGDSVTYHFDKERDVKRIHILQTADKISNARIYARTIDKEEILLGVLDQGYTILDMPERVDLESIKIVFTSDAEVELNELTFEYYTFQAVKEEAEQMLQEAEQLLTLDKSKNAKAALQGMMDACHDAIATEDKAVLVQALDDLKAAMEQYEDSMNKDHLASIIATAKSMDTTRYTENSVNKMNEALKQAEAVYADVAATQEQIDHATSALTEAVRLLVIIDDTDPSHDKNSIYSEDGKVKVTGLSEEGISLIIQMLNQMQIDQILSVVSDPASLALLDTFTVEELYQLELQKDGKTYSPTESFNVSIKLKEALKEKQLGVVRISEDGIITELPSEIVNGQIVFTTDQNANYGIVSYKDGKPNHGADTGVTDQSGILALLFVSGGAMMIVMLKKKKEA